MSIYLFSFNNLIHFIPRALLPSSLFNSCLPILQKFESSLHCYPLTLQGDTPFPIVIDPTTKDLTLLWLTNLNFPEVKLKFLWEKNDHDTTATLKFIYRNKTANLSTQTPNWISKYPVLAISFEAVTSGWTRLKARGWRDRSLFSQRVVRQALFMCGYVTTLIRVSWVLKFLPLYHTESSNDHST